MAHDTGGVDDDGGPVGDALGLEIQPERRGEGALGVEVREERERDAAEALALVGVGVDAIDAHTQGLRVGGEKSG